VAKPAPMPFTPEFARLVCEAYQAAGAVCSAAGASHVVTVSGTTVQVGDGYNGRQITMEVDDALLKHAYPAGP
jgi:hypothetical protein